MALGLGVIACGDNPASPAIPELVNGAAVIVNSAVITPSMDTITTTGGSVQLSVVLRDPAGKVIPGGTVPVSWIALNPKKSSVSASGKVTGIASSGLVQVTAKAGAKMDTATITLLAALTGIPSSNKSTLAASPSTIPITAGGTQFTIMVKDGSGKPVPNATVTVSSTGSGNIISSLTKSDSTGSATAMFSSGVAETKTITATANGVTLAKAAIVVVSKEAIATVLQCIIPAIPPLSAVSLTTDVTYNTSGGTTLKLDIARPKTAGLHPLVVVVHGGGWYKGDKVDFRNEILFLAGQGYTAVAVNYRLVKGSSNLFPAAIQDLRCSLRWLRSRASTYSFDPNRAAAIGVSSGGNLADMLGLASSAGGLDGACTSSGPMVPIKAVVAYAGPSDLRKSSLFTSQSLPIVTNYLGGAPESKTALAILASPITHLSSGDPITLLVQGTADPVVPVSHSLNLKAALNLAAVAATFVPLQGLGHGISLFSTATAERAGSCTTIAFLGRELQP
ncbi:MAG: alpha/beta fold hydrolase [Gemmatimonadota bacterium]